MNWFKENKFIAGVLGVTVLGAGGLGFLLVTAQGKYEEASSNFDQQSAELHRLKTLPAYPNQQNVKKLEAQKEASLAVVEKLQKELAATQLPLEPIAPTQFQDRLRDSVTNFLAKSAGKMELPDKGAFYLGFSRYQGAPPTSEAAPLVNRELKEIEIILNILLDSRVAALKEFNREELPEERGKGKESKGLVQKHVLDLVIYGEQASTQSVLNKLTALHSPFVITRYIGVENDAQKGPAKENPALAAASGLPEAAPAPVPAAAPSTPTPATPAAGAPAAPGAAASVPGPALKFIVGDEKVTTTLRLELVGFADPSSGNEGRKSKKSASN